MIAQDVFININIIFFFVNLILYFRQVNHKNYLKMRKIIFKDPDKIRTSKTKRWLGWLTFCMMMFVGQIGFAQIDYAYDWEPTGAGSWTGGFSRSTTTPCTGSASARVNNYYGGQSFLVSPALTGTNGGD